MPNKKLAVDYQKGRVSFIGELTLETIKDAFALQGKQVNVIDASQLIKLDTAGALLILHLLKARPDKKNLINLKAEEQTLIDLVADQEAVKVMVAKNKLASQILKRERIITVFTFFYYIGRGVVNKLIQIQGFLALIGELFFGFLKSLFSKKRFPLKNIFAVVDNAGCRALPILGLLAFLIGIVLAYQVGVQLKVYGANSFVVLITSTAILREFGPLMAAVIIAGRSSSAFTAEIGTMKVNEEIDALQTMGISPVERLILPKVIGMLIIFPILIFWTDILGILGSMLMSKISLDIGFLNFINQFQASVKLKQFWVGMSKAPVFALIIAMVGCYQGFLVESSSESVGRHTTKSVVQAIFLIIIVDAIFSIVFNYLRI